MWWKRILLLMLIVAAITRTHSAEDDEADGEEPPAESQHDEPLPKPEAEHNEEADQDKDQGEDQDKESKDQPDNDEDDDDDDDDDESSNNESTTSNTTVVTSEATPGAPQAPEESYYLIGDDNKICVAVNLDVGFAFNVLSVTGSNMTKNINLPEKAPSYGDCGEDNKEPRLTIECDDDVNFTLSFKKTHGGEEWALTEMELQLNPSKFFRRENEGSSLTLTARDVSMFTAPMKQSFSCKEPLDGIVFYTTEDTPAAYAVINSIRMQAFDVPPEFGSERICNDVNEASPSKRIDYRSDTAPIAIGLTCAILTLFGVMAFAVHRIMHQKKVDYSNM